MHRSFRSKTLLATVTAKHTREEEKLIRACADAAGSTVSDWARQTHLQALSSAPDTRLLLAELLAFRRLFLALKVDAIQSKPPNEEGLRAAMDDAERAKFEMADKRIAAFHDVSKKSAMSAGRERIP